MMHGQVATTSALRHTHCFPLASRKNFAAEPQVVISAIPGQTMNPKPLHQKVASAIGGGLIGGILGALLAAVGNVASSSVLAIAATVVIGASVGWSLDGLSGTLLGAVYGALFSATGSVIGGTMLGVSLTIIAAAVLGGWLSWSSAFHDDNSSRPVRNSKRVPAKAPHDHAKHSQFVEERLIWI